MDNANSTQIKGFHDLLGPKLCISMYVWLVVLLSILLIITFTGFSIDVPVARQSVISFIANMHLSLSICFLYFIIKFSKHMIRINKREFSYNDFLYGEESIVTVKGLYVMIISSIIFFTISLILHYIFNFI